MSRRIGIIGFGHLGEYLTACIENSEILELAFVWNRTRGILEEKLDDDFILDDLQDFTSKSPDVVVEVSHPSITQTWGKTILSYCDYVVGSPTAFCVPEVERELRLSCFKHALYVPSGAFWGGNDIQKMSESGNIEFLKVTMKKHPLSLKLDGKLKEENAAVKDVPVVLYEGTVRNICKIAPQNTNTMAVAAIAAQNLGFDGVQGCLISDPNLVDRHVVEIELNGFSNSNGSRFEVQTIRQNPAVPGEVTGSATFASFFSSLKRAEGKASGIHLC